MIILFFSFILNVQCANHEEYSLNLLQKTDVSYGIHPCNKLDIYYPDGIDDLMPVVLFVHGGGWSQGDKTDWDLNKALFFLQNGFISISINYRLSPYPYEFDNLERVQHPDHVSDLALALRWVLDNIGIFGGDEKRIYLMGHSAGAQLVSLLGTNERFLNEQNIKFQQLKGIISLDGGPYLTIDENLLFLDDNLFSDEYYRNVKYSYYNAFGFDKDVHRDASPYYNVEINERVPPFLLICQTALYRYQPNAQLYEKLLQTNCMATLFVANNYDHGMIYNAIGNPYDPMNVTVTVLDFLKKNEK